MSKHISKNVPNWLPTVDDYILLFCEVQEPDGSYLWRECSHNLPKYADMLLCDYLAEMQIVIPDFTQFLRIYDHERNLHFEYRAYGGRVTISVDKFIFD